MSQRHRSQEAVPPPKMDSRAHAHNERHRIHSELDAVAAQVSAGYEPDELHEPGRAWVPSHHHDAEKAKAGNGNDRQASLEDEDVEAAHERAQGEGAGLPHRQRVVVTSHQLAVKSSRRSCHSSTVIA